MKLDNVEKSLKRFLKKKVSYSLSLLVAFMISGEISMATDITQKQLQGTKEQILTKIRAEKIKIKNKIAVNEKKIKQCQNEFYDLVNQADFYAKPALPSTQIFFSTHIEDDGKGKDRTTSEFAETLEASKEYLGSEEKAKEKLAMGLGTVVDTSTFRESVDIGANIKPVVPVLPVVQPSVTVSASAPTVTIGVLPQTPTMSTITVPTVSGIGYTPVSLPTVPTLPTISTPSGVGTITITSPVTPEAPSVGTRNLNVSNPNAPASFKAYKPIKPTKPNSPTIHVPNVFTPPALQFVGQGFGQGPDVGTPLNKIILQNYETYSTTAPVEIVADGNGTSWSGGTINMTTVVNPSAPTSLAPGSTPASGMCLNAFINELRDHNAIIGGDYEMSDRGVGETIDSRPSSNPSDIRTNNVKIFLSHNPAGVGNPVSYQGTYTPGERRAKFTGTLKLHGITSPDPTYSRVLVGVEHQLWNMDAHPGAYSVFENTGTITLEDGYNMIGIMLDCEAMTNPAGARHKTINSGKIIINAENSIGIDLGEYDDANLLDDLTLGNIEVNGKHNYGFRMANIFHGQVRPSGAHPANDDNYFDRGFSVTSGTGKIVVKGSENVGVSIGKDLSATANANPIANFTGINIEVDGTNNIGFLRNKDYSTNNTGDMILDSTTMGTFNFASTATDSVLIRSDKHGIQIAKDIAIGTAGTGNSIAQAIDDGFIINKNKLSVTGTVGDMTGLLAGHSSTASGNPTVTNDTTGNIEMSSSGNNNVGMVILENAIGEQKGTISVTGTGTNKAGIYNKGTLNISSGTITAEGKDTSAIYNLSGTNITGANNINTGKGAIGIFSDGGTVNSTAGNGLVITGNDTGSTDKGVAVFADNGANISLHNAVINVTDGAAAVASYDTATTGTTNIDLQGAKISYNGEGYAVYTDGKGEVDLTNGAEITLDGKAIGVELQAGAPKIHMDNSTKIIMNSNDAIVTNITGVSSMNYSSFKNDIMNTYLGGVTIQDGIKSGITQDKYKIAIVDGGNFVIDSNMDKFDKNTSSDGYFYSRRFLGMKQKVTLDPNMTVTAKTDTTYATDYFNNQVVGLEMSSSESAGSLSDTQINLESGSSIIAERTDNSGSGAIGAYINFGELTAKNGSVIDVEGTQKNSNAVGIYGVNGSHILNSGTVTVDGKQSTGILGMSYRDDGTTKYVDEFGTALTDQGKLNIVNDSSGTIELKGNNSIGIAVYNNSIGTTHPINVSDIVADNKGTITVGADDGGKPSIAIYGEGATLSNNGAINVGDNSIGIYGAKGSNINVVNSIALGKDGIGVMADGTTDITAPNITITHLSGAGSDVDGKVGVYYKGTGSENKTLTTNINTTSLSTKPINLFVEDMSVTSNGNLKVGDNGVGIYSKGASGNGINGGTIDLVGTNSVGMYSADNSVTNNGTINLTSSGQTGIYVEGAGHRPQGTGTININTNGGTGIFVKGGAEVNVGTGGLVTFNSANSNAVGYFAEAGKIHFNGNITFAQPNSNSNILSYAKDGSTVDIASGQTVKIDGVSSASSGKTVGTYLENSTAQNTFTGNGDLEVTNEAVGIYSKGINSITVNKLTSKGAGTIGIYVDGKSDVDGTIKVESDGIGIYGIGDTISLTGTTVDTSSGTATGIYLANGANLSGTTPLTLKNSSGVQNIGVYYTKDNASFSSPVSNDIDINVLDGKDIAIYVANGLELTNNNNIKMSGDTDIASFVSGGSKYISKGDINVNGTNSIGVYVENGEGVNEKDINVTNTTSSSISMGMVAKSNTAGVSAIVENKGNITVSGNKNLGMYAGDIGDSTLKNSGTINAQNTTAVYVEGATNSFDGTNGTINSDKIGVALKGTSAGKITLGNNLNIGTNGVGVYSDGSQIDFDINLQGQENIGLLSKGATNVSGDITVGNGAIGVVVGDNGVQFNGTTITTGNNLVSSTGPSYAVGMLLSEDIGSINLSNVDVKGTDGIGIYLQKQGAGSGTALRYGGTVDVTTGVGIYVEKGTSLETNNTILNVDGGTGIYINEGTVKAGVAKPGSPYVAGPLKINFGANGGIGIFNNAGTLTTGDIQVSGSGTLSATLNGTLINNGTLLVSQNAKGLLGIYNGNMTAPQKLVNDVPDGEIEVTNGGLGIVAIKDKTAGATNPSYQVTIENKNKIKADGTSTTGEPSVAIYSEVADVKNSGTIEVKDKSVGIYTNDIGVGTTIDNSNSINMIGNDSVGLYIKGNSSGILSNTINSVGGSRNTGVVLDGTTTTLNVGTLNMGDESVGVMATNSTNTTIDGNIKVGDSGSSKSAIGVVVNNGSNLTLSNNTQITAGDKGIGVYVDGSGNIANISDVTKISVGNDGVYMFAKDGSINYNGNITTSGTNGIVVDGGTINGNGSIITVTNGGVGAYLKNNGTISNVDVAVQAGTSTKHSIGLYYDNVASISSIPMVNQNGNYTVGVVLDNGSVGVGSNPITLGTGTNQVGMIVKGGSDLTLNSPINITSDNNIGIYGENSLVKVNGDINVGASTATTNKSKSSIGVTLDGGKYQGTGDISVGNDSVGIYAKNLNGVNSLVQTGNNLTVGDNGLGIFAEGSGDTTVNMGNITIGNNNSIGTYVKGVSTTVKGDISVGSDTSIGIVSEGTGDVNYTGKITVADKINSGSVGIYKNEGTGTITTSNDNWTLGKNSYGIYVNQGTTGNSAIINNNANMNLDKSAVGIYSNGANTINNNGDIIVGETDVKGDHNKISQHINSVGIYGTNGTTAVNNGTITTLHDHSVGAYLTGVGTTFTNKGTMNVDNGGVGVLVRDGAIAINDGTIKLGGTKASCGTESIGMAAYNARIENRGNITVDEGIGMLVGTGATFANTGTINVRNGVGIEGQGTLLNTGTVSVIAGGTGSTVASSGPATAKVGSVQITSNGVVTINNNYVSIGGTFVTDSAVVVNGAYADITSNMPVFNAPSVSGEVRILPNFAGTGNGVTYKVENFLVTAASSASGGKLTPVTSPLFIPKITGSGDLVVVKKPYADLSVGKQFDNLHNGLDNILYKSNGVGTDAEILKGLNEYLEGLPEADFEREASTKLSETRGDVYSTIQKRMQNIDKAFDTAFNELEDSYNFTKDTDKYSVIYTKGKFEDGTLGIDDYDYDIAGLLYMKEKDGNNLNTKHGYTLGFTGSKFKFDDGGSKEEVYSVRAGAHNVVNLSKEHKVSWLTRGEIGYNRHRMERELNLDKDYKNKAEYNTYTVSFDNKITKNIYADFENKLDIYADLETEYGKVGEFSEKSGGLKLKVKDNDYFSAKLGVGAKASKRVYIGKLWSAKATADVKYAYELGENYDGNKAKLKDGDEGYYKLITPEKEKGKAIGKVGVTFEKANNMGVTFEVEGSSDEAKEKPTVKYGVRLNYKFFN